MFGTRPKVSAAESATASYPVEVQGVTKHYPGAQALKGVDLVLPRGELAIMTGPSGSGKSTMMRILNGIEQADAGAVHVLGHDFTSMSRRKRQAVIAGHVALTFQSAKHDRSFSVLDNVQLPANSKAHAVDPYKLARMAEIFDMGDALFRPPSQLSGGQQIRVALMRAMATDKSLILMDEPTNHLDTHNKTTVFEAIRTAVTDLGATALIVTHDADFGREVADREFAMRDGELVDTLVFER